MIINHKVHAIATIVKLKIASGVLPHKSWEPSRREPTATAWHITDADPISLEHYEKKVILRAIDACNGDKQAAARLLRLGKSTMYRKIHRYGIS